MPLAGRRTAALVVLAVLRGVTSRTTLDVEVPVEGDLGTTDNLAKAKRRALRDLKSGKKEWKDLPGWLKTDEDVAYRVARKKAIDLEEELDQYPVLNGFGPEHAGNAGYHLGVVRNGMEYRVLMPHQQQILKRENKIPQMMQMERQHYLKSGVLEDISFSEVPPRLQRDPAVVLEGLRALKRQWDLNPFDHKEIVDDLRERTDSTPLRYASETHRNRKRFVEEAVRIYGLALADAGKFRKDPRIVAEAVGSIGAAREFSRVGIEDDDDAQFDDDLEGPHMGDKREFLEPEP